MTNARNHSNHDKKSKSKIRGSLLCSPSLQVGSATFAPCRRRIYPMQIDGVNVQIRDTPPVIFVVVKLSESSISSSIQPPVNFSSFPPTASPWRSSWCISIWRRRPKRSLPRCASPAPNRNPRNPPAARIALLSQWPGKTCG
jgi:hypothetical protein